MEPQYNSIGVRIALARMICQDEYDLRDNLTAAEHDAFARLLAEIETYESLDASWAA